MPRRWSKDSTLKVIPKLSLAYSYLLAPGGLKGYFRDNLSNRSSRVAILRQARVGTSTTSPAFGAPTCLPRGYPWLQTVKQCCALSEFVHLLAYTKVRIKASYKSPRTRDDLLDLIPTPLHLHRPCHPSYSDTIGCQKPHLVTRTKERPRHGCQSLFSSILCAEFRLARPRVLHPPPTSKVEGEGLVEYQSSLNAMDKMAAYIKVGAAGDKKVFLHSSVQYTFLYESHRIHLPQKLEQRIVINQGQTLAAAIAH